MSSVTVRAFVPAGFGRVAGLAGAVARRLAAIGRAFHHRRELAALAAFDDRMLADIGLTRGDIRDAVAQLPWHDPTEVLTTRADERRRARRQTAAERCAPDRAVLDAPPTAPEIDAWSSAQFPARSRYY
ncbi:MAG TPA: DUF1127 domain-containing protein [Xanthobacteraceae bacterium]|nr:DUF1127 domain-containing protein [Xanthobacteraceae bacterium]